MTPPGTGLGQRFPYRLSLAETRSIMFGGGRARLIPWSLPIGLATWVWAAARYGATPVVAVAFIGLVMTGYMWLYAEPHDKAAASGALEILVDEHGVQLWLGEIHTLYPWTSFDQVLHRRRMLLLHKRDPKVTVPLLRRCFTNVDLATIEGWVRAAAQ